MVHLRNLIKRQRGPHGRSNGKLGQTQAKKPLPTWVISVVADSHLAAAETKSKAARQGFT